MLDPARARNFGVFTSAECPHQLVVDGRVAGSWAREVTRTSATVALRWHAPPAARHRTGLAREAKRFGRFHGVPCALRHETPG